MSERTLIQWTAYPSASGGMKPGATFNPWIGCTMVSPGCANCYAAAQDKFRSWTPEGWGKGKPRKRTSEANWRGPLKWNAEAERLGERPRVFCASLADWLDDEVPIKWLADLLDLIRRTPNLDWLLLTKRPQHFFARLEECVGYNPDDEESHLTASWVRDWLIGTAPDNVWIGTTVEDQYRADLRRDVFQAIPAAVHFVSYEPAIGPVDWTGWEFIDWLISGGESGSGARPSHPDWHRAARDFCRENRKAYFFKQHGEWLPAEVSAPELPGELRRITVRTPVAHPGPRRPEFHDWPDGNVSARVGKKAAGNLLDGRTYEEMPEVSCG